jgi:hypothetical protein
MIDRAAARFAALSALVVSAVVLGGCCTETDCRGKYGLKKCEECPTAATPVTPSPHPPPGPIIIIKKGTGDTMKFYDDDVEQSFTGSVGADCLLRDDFIGTEILQFEIHYADGSVETDAKKFMLTVDGASNTKKRKLLVQRDPQNRIRWNHKNTYDPTLSCSALSPSGSSNTGTVPIEFDDYPESSCMGGPNLDKPCSWVKLQVEVLQ